MMEIADSSLPLLPDEKPKYIMGVGTPEDLVELVSKGADMFDCVMPTRNARNGQLFTSRGKININNAEFKYHTDPRTRNAIATPAGTIQPPISTTFTGPGKSSPISSTPSTTCIITCT